MGFRVTVKLHFITLLSFALLISYCKAEESEAPAYSVERPVYSVEAILAPAEDPPHYLFAWRDPGSDAVHLEKHPPSWVLNPSTWHGGGKPPVFAIYNPIGDIIADSGVNPDSAREIAQKVTQERLTFDMAETERLLRQAKLLRAKRERRVEPGMSEDEVRFILGEPSDIRIEESNNNKSRTLLYQDMRIVIKKDRVTSSTFDSRGSLYR